MPRSFDDNALGIEVNFPYLTKLLWWFNLLSNGISYDDLTFLVYVFLFHSMSFPTQTTHVTWQSDTSPIVCWIGWIYLTHGSLLCYHINMMTSTLYRFHQFLLFGHNFVTRNLFDDSFAQTQSLIELFNLVHFLRILVTLIFELFWSPMARLLRIGSLYQLTQKFYSSF